MILRTELVSAITSMLLTWHAAGKGYSVLDVIHAFEKACGHPLKYEIKPRRDGDIATCYSKCDKAKEELGWEAEYGIEEMCADSWNWQQKNPNGYND